MEELTVVNFTNIDNQDYDGQWGGEITVIKAGETKQFPKFLAEHYCKHLVNKMIIRGGQDWTNDLLRKPLEERILGNVEVKAEIDERPEFIKGGPIETPKVEEFEDKPKEEVVKEEPKKRGRKKVS
jgi:hypothetical protein